MYAVVWNVDEGNQPESVYEKRVAYLILSYLVVRKIINFTMVKTKKDLTLL
jgi:hypothetical protein